MPLVFTKAPLVRVDFFPRPQFAGAQFTSTDAKFVHLNTLPLYKDWRR